MFCDMIVVFSMLSAITVDKAKAQSTFESLIHKLGQVGLATEVRKGSGNSVLVFVRLADEEYLFGEVYRSRVKDWIYGVRTGEPAKDTKVSLEEDPLTDAERLRIIYQLITNDEKDGGAGIKPKHGEWENVEAVFALHDQAYNKRWLQKWSTQWQLKLEDLDEIRNRFGEKVAYYFAFEQTYFNFLLFPSAVGFFAWLALGSFSPIYAVLACFWCVVFVEWWKHQEKDLALRWGVANVSTIESKRNEFRATKQVEDPATGEIQMIFPVTERLQRQVLQLPFALLAMIVLGSLIVTCLAIELFIGELYDGPGKSVLTFLPTIILTTCMPLLTGALTDVAKRLNQFENYETESQFERHLTTKLLVLDFITSYMPLMLTAFVYVPFGAVLVPYLDVLHVVTNKLSKNPSKVKAKTKDYSINPDRLRKQVIYFAVTASIINFCTEVVVPYLKRRGFVKMRELQNKKSGGKPSQPTIEDAPEEKDFMARVRSEVELPAYDVYTDIREMVIQFGYLSLFSVVWPMVPVAYLVNNWFELRADAFKICMEMQRPTPWRADTIGPWLDALGFLTWLGSLTMAAVAYMFSNDGVGPDGNPYDLKAWVLLLSIFFSEHIYLFVHFAVAFGISKIDSPGRQKERRDRFLTRQKFVQDSLSQVQKAPILDEKRESITRQSLEEDARRGSLQTASPEERFWSRQRGWRESAQVGKGMIDKAVADDKENEKSKKEL